MICNLRILLLTILYIDDNYAFMYTIIITNAINTISWLKKYNGKERQLLSYSLILLFKRENYLNYNKKCYCKLRHNNDSQDSK